jgi:hypothetical protein
MPLPLSNAIVMAIQLGSRIRERKLVQTSQKLGTQFITYEGQNAGTVPYTSTIFGHPAYDWSLLQKCWDELHSREEVIKYYIKKKCHRRVYLSPDEVLAYKTIYRNLGQHPPDLYAKVAKGGPWSSGGPFTLITASRLDELQVKGKGVYVNRDIKPWEAKYVGGFLPTGFSTYSGSSAVDIYQGWTPNSSAAEIQNGLESLGAKAWNKARPKTASFDLPTAIGELRDLPGMLKTSAKSFHDLYRSIAGSSGNKSRKELLLGQVGPKGVSETFLNHAFGWAPFVGDLIKMYETYESLDKNIHQLVRDNGQWIRRRVRVEETAEFFDRVKVPGNVPSVYPTLHDWCYAPRNGKVGETEFFKEKYLETWFVGRFRYYIPRPPDNPDTKTYNRVLDVLRQYGVHLSPSVIWNLTPWSWMSDWFGNAGDIIDNIDAQNNDNLTAKYAYLMRRSRLRYVNDSTVYLKGAKDGVRMTWAREINHKTRIEATPFGFGLTGGGLNSAYRVAILSALGLTRNGNPFRFGPG